MCRVCKKHVHTACAAAAKALIATRSAKKFDKFVCRKCSSKSLDAASHGSENSEITEDDNMKSILLKMNKKRPHGGKIETFG
jgi:hypothetical protein